MSFKNPFIQPERQKRVQKFCEWEKSTRIFELIPWERKKPEQLVSEGMSVYEAYTTSHAGPYQYTVNDLEDLIKSGGNEIFQRYLKRLLTEINRIDESLQLVNKDQKAMYHCTDKFSRDLNRFRIDFILEYQKKGLLPTFDC